MMAVRTILTVFALLASATPAWSQATFSLGSNREEVLQVQGTPSDINRYPAAGFQVWRYGRSSVKISLATGKVVEFSNSGQLQVSLIIEREHIPVQYHHTVGDVRLYYDDAKVYSGVLSFSDPDLGEVYGFTNEGVVYFYDASLQPLDLYAYANEGKSFSAGTFRGSRSSTWLSNFSSRLSLIDITGDVAASGTAMRFGNMTFYDLIAESGSAVHGTSLDFGTVGFDDFYSTDGVSLSGSRIEVGNFSFGDWWSSDGTTVGGTTSRIGNIQFHDYSGSDGRTYTGTTIDIGNFSFTDITGQ